MSTVQLAQIVSSVFPVPAPADPSRHADLPGIADRRDDELGALRDGLNAAISAVRRGGRVAVISFHSLEDRIVKQTLVGHAKGCICPPRLPVCRCGRKPDLKVLTRRPVTATEDEIAANPAARSAKLRGAEKV